jgi:hypothetical protein
VTAEEPRRLGLELRFDVEPIQGRLYDQADRTGLDRRFLGWLGLLSAIEAARPGHQQPPGRHSEGKDRR